MLRQRAMPLMPVAVIYALCYAMLLFDAMMLLSAAMLIRAFSRAFMPMLMMLPPPPHAAATYAADISPLMPDAAIDAADITPPQDDMLLMPALTMLP